MEDSDANSGDIPFSGFSVREKRYYKKIAMTAAFQVGMFRNKNTVDSGKHGMEEYKDIISNIPAELNPTGIEIAIYVCDAVISAAEKLNDDLVVENKTKRRFGSI